ncbi:MAG: response regulator [Saprospiraceae bacterium]
MQILLVEDHPMHQIATRQLLTTWSELVTVTIANNGKIALDKAKEQSFDIILLDIQMPVMDGMTAAMHLRQFSTVPIIASPQTPVNRKKIDASK